MRFRFKAFGFHALASALALTMTIGALYAGWYRWPGWYLADVLTVFGVMAGADLVLGPLLTFTVASPKKTKRVLARDLAVIAAVQLIALAYGTVALWNGRPLYYAFSENSLSLVQAYDIEPEELALARKQNAQFAPHWYSLPRWIWAPLPSDANEHDRIVQSAIQGGSDVIAMPRYFKNWAEGLPELKTQLQKVDEIKFFNSKEKKALKARMEAAGFSADEPNGIAFTGRGRPMLALFDAKGSRIIALFTAT